MTLRTPSILLATAALGLGVAACGATTLPPQAAKAAPKPVAQVDQLSGQRTAVTLDAGFVEALQTLKLTPAPVGDATISKAGVAVVPDHRRQRHVLQARQRVARTCRARSTTTARGLSLTGGGKKVELTDFVVDPGASVLTGTVSVDGKVAARTRRCSSSTAARSSRSRSTTTAPPCSRARRSSSRPRPLSC